MTDELINANNDDLIINANHAENVITPTKICTEITTATSPCEQSEAEIEKPIILELGVSSTNATLNSTANIYPLDIQASNVTNYINQQNFISSNDSTSSLIATQLYSNPYSYANAVGNVFKNTYPQHIPQTVCTWSTMEHLEARAEIVPPPIYVSYMGSRELSIVKEANPSWKEKALQIEKDYKKTACDRERTRMRDMNRAFDLLRSKLPISKPNGKKYSKIESLRIAINYIHHLQECLKADSSDITNFSMINKSSGRTSTSEYVLERNNQRAIYQFSNAETRGMYDESEQESDKIQNDTWNDGGYLSTNNQQDQWD